MNKEFKFSIVCCDKEKKKIETQSLNRDVGEEMIFICLDCGKLDTIILSESLDEEELFNILEHYEDDEIKKSKIYEELSHKAL